MRANRPRNFGSMLYLRRSYALCLIGSVLLLLAFIAFLFTPPMPADLSLGRADLRLSTWLSVSWSMSPPEAVEVMKLTERLAALAGMKLGLAARLDGIALYPFWETNENESKLIACSLGR